MSTQAEDDDKPGPLAEKTFTVTFKFRADGRVQYVFAKPDMCFQAGGTKDFAQLQARIAEMVAEETKGW